MTKITREELYDLVWKEPTRKVAERFGISDVGLAKACRRHRIPRPPRGYWQKLRFGKRVRRKLLPKLDERELRELSTVQLGDYSSSSIQLDELVREQKEIESDLKHRIKVPHELTRAHRLLRPNKRSKQTLRGVLHKRLCRKCYPRGLRLLDALLKGLDERGFTPEPVSASESIALFGVQVHGQVLAMNLTEQKDRVEKRRQRRRLLYYRTDDIFGPGFESYYISVCSGRLTLSIVDRDVQRVRQNWTDTEKRRLEDQLNRFFVGLVAASQVKKRRIAERTVREKQWAEDRRRREEERRRQEEELRRIHHLEAWSEEWAKAHRLRAFLSTIRQSLDERSIVDLPETLGPWMQWAEDYVARLDPVPQIVERGPDAIPQPSAPSAYLATSWPRVNWSLPE